MEYFIMNAIEIFLDNDPKTLFKDFSAILFTQSISSVEKVLKENCEEKWRQFDGDYIKIYEVHHNSGWLLGFNISHIAYEKRCIRGFIYKETEHPVLRDLSDKVVAASSISKIGIPKGFKLKLSDEYADFNV